ncbi:unnamed protein product [Brassica rapa subsp. narinosa]
MLKGINSTSTLLSFFLSQDSFLNQRDNLEVLQEAVEYSPPPEVLLGAVEDSPAPEVLRGGVEDSPEAEGEDTNLYSLSL